MNLWQKLADLPLRVEQCELEPLQMQISEEFTRRTTLIRLRGQGEDGIGEDVTYDAPDHDVLQAAGPPAQLIGRHTLASFSEALRKLELFPQPPQREVSRRYRVWAYESAALDLALRQSRLSLHRALEIEPSPLRFVVSLRLEEPPTLQPIERRLQIAPSMHFKLDPTPSWDEAFLASLARLNAVDTVDLKGCYEGTIVDNPADPALYRRVAEALPEAWIEDPKLTPETEEALRPYVQRITWDAPIHERADIEALARKPRCINVKPSRIGRLQDLFALYEHCDAHGIACYGGGQTELGPGRGQIQYLASLFHPDAPNDVAPRGWNWPHLASKLSGSPLPASPELAGFRWRQ